MLFGHEDKVKIFEQMFKNGNLGQSYFFFGDSQIGKKSFAVLLANFLEFGKFEIKEEPLFDSRVFKGNEKGTIGIDESREIKRFLWTTPFKSSRRMAIIDNVENLTLEAQSALLKIVEEPPSSALIVFVGQDEQALFPPLLSRLKKIYFSRLPNEKIKEILQKFYNVKEGKALEISNHSFGRVGRALELLEQKDKDHAGESLENLIEKEVLKLRGEDLIGNSFFISKLINRLTNFKRFNLNENLQRKALDFEIKK